ncbi:transposase [Streptococcus pneumoniae]|nr:transposase [Streptococcus pneumoniae]
MVNCEQLEAYRQLEEAALVGCWAHVRRKFFEATPKQADKSSLGAKGLAYCDQLFSLERDWEALPADERLQKRQEHLQPLLEDFFAWCRRQSVLSGSKLGRAIEYSLKYELIVISYFPWKETGRLCQLMNDYRNVKNISSP